MIEITTTTKIMTITGTTTCCSQVSCNKAETSTQLPLPRPTANAACQVVSETVAQLPPYPSPLETDTALHPLPWPSKWRAGTLLTFGKPTPPDISSAAICHTFSRYSTKNKRPEERGRDGAKSGRKRGGKRKRRRSTWDRDEFSGNSFIDCKCQRCCGR